MCQVDKTQPAAAGRSKDKLSWVHKATQCALTWGNINGSREHCDKSVQRVLVEGVDLVQAVQQEEEHGSSGCYCPILHVTEKDS